MNYRLDKNYIWIGNCGMVLSSKGIHWQYNTTITHGGCEDIVLETDSGDAVGAIEDYDAV